MEYVFRTLIGKNKKWIIYAVAIFVLVLVYFSPIKVPVYKQLFVVFGTEVEVIIHGGDDKLAWRTIKEIEDDFLQLHNEWHGWEEGGFLSKINRAFAEGRELAVEQEVADFLEKNQMLAAKTNYLFEPGLGHLYSLWGFHSRQIKQPPPQEQIDKILASRPSIKNVQFDGRQLSSTNSMVKIDVGGSAKGYFLQRAITHLKRNGIENAVVSIGGDLQVIGAKINPVWFGTKIENWKIGVKNPDITDKTKIVGSLELESGENIFTSGVYERFFEYNGKRYAHIINPQTGYPVVNTLAVTVIHEDGIIADIAATTLMVAGVAGWQEIMAALKLDMVLLIDSEFKWHMTPKMAERFESYK